MNKLEYAFQTDIGKVRVVNEDSVGFIKNKNNLYLGLVADGIGGNQGGDVASAMITSHLGYLFENSNYKTIEQAYMWLQRQLQVENDLLIQKGKQYTDLEGMGTTLVCLLAANKSCIIANIGDSRGYRFRNGKLIQITQDHSLVNALLKEGAITREEAQNHPQKNVIVRTLGINHDAQMDRYTLSVQPNDIFLLCTDGLSKLVSSQEITEILNTNDSLEQKCAMLVSKAREKGGTDNITVLLTTTRKGGDPECA